MLYCFKMKVGVGGGEEYKSSKKKMQLEEMETILRKHSTTKVNH